MSYNEEVNMKKVKALLCLVCFLIVGTSQAAEDCRIIAKKKIAGSSYPMRLNNPLGRLSFKDCMQKATEVIQGKDELKTRVSWDSLMIQHTSRTGKINVFKFERSSAQAFEQYYLFD